MEYWSDGSETVGLRPMAHGVRGKTFCLAPDTANIHYSSTPSLQLERTPKFNDQ